ncbi:MAG TPA: S1 RNA-binding domain-containing protein, partial [Anaerolineae bacterium]
MTRVVQVEVLEIQPGGVLVKLLADDRTGFIRRGELSWDRRVGMTPPLPQAGEHLEAKIIKERKESPEVYLSPRQLIDPWHEVEKTYHPDQVVRGEVVNIRHFGVFVQLEPGLDAIVWPRDMPLRRDQRPAEILSIGDQVQGVITLIDLKKHKLELSLTRQLEALSLAPGPARKSIQLELFQDNVASIKTGPAVPSLTAPLKDQAARRRYHAPLPKPETLLLIDDNGTHLSEIRQQLEKMFSFDIDSVSSGRAALEHVRGGRNYDLAIIDLKLTNEHGTRVAEELLERLPDLAVLFTSLDPQAEKTLPMIKGRTFPFAIKEPEEIAEWIDKLSSGYWEGVPEPTTAYTAYTGPGNVIQQLELTALARRSLPDRLRQMLADLRAETNASQGLVLELDSASKSASIIAAEPPLKKDIYEQSLDNLYYSPARDVVENGTEFLATRIDQDRDARFKNLLPLLAYKSFIGLPLTVPDLAARHALFLFNEHRPEFEPEEIDRARLAAKFMQVALERGLLLDT